MSVHSRGPQHGRQLRNLAAQDSLQRVDVLTQNANRFEPPLSSRVRPIGSKLVEQPLVSSFEFRSWQRAGPDDSRFQIAITQRDRERRFAFDHRLALIESLPDAGIGAVAQGLTPIVDGIEDSSLAPRHRFKRQLSRRRRMSLGLKRDQPGTGSSRFASTAALLRSDPMVSMSASARSETSRLRRYSGSAFA